MKSMNWGVIVGVALLLGAAALGLREGRAHRGTGASVGVAKLALRTLPGVETVSRHATATTRGNTDEVAVRLDELRGKRRELEANLATLNEEMARLDPNALRDALELTW
jgi:hypothetical protein